MKSLHFPEYIQLLVNPYNGTLVVSVPTPQLIDKSCLYLDWSNISSKSFEFHSKILLSRLMSYTNSPFSYGNAYIIRGQLYEKQNLITFDLDENATLHHTEDKEEEVPYE